MVVLEVVEVVVVVVGLGSDSGELLGSLSQNASGNVT